MRLQNSYIFLVNQNTKKSKSSEGKRVFEFRPTVHSYISKCFGGTSTYGIDDWYYQHETIWNSGDNSEECTVAFRLYSVIGTTYLDVAVEGETNDVIIKCLEYVHTTLHSSGICSDYVMIISYDAVSEFYCNKLYPKLNELERNLRKLLFNIYTVNFGSEYYKMTISDDIQTKAKENIRAKGNASKKEITVLQEFFYSLEFGDVRQMLFTPRWTELNTQNAHNFLNEHSDLSILSDAELRSSIANIIPQSDWDRFFGDKIASIDFEGILNTIRDYRNKVAHCKIVTESEYQDCLRVTKELNDAILDAIKATEDIDFEKKNREYLHKMVKELADTIQSLSTAYSSMANSVMHAAQSTVDSLKDMFDRINPSSLLLDEEPEQGDVNEGDAMVEEKRS